jgi:hypothetical protein
MYLTRYSVSVVRHFNAILPEVERMRAIEDPIVRAAEATSASAEIRDLVEDLNEMREQAIYELFKQIGGTKAAAAFGLSRASLYRIVWRQEPKDADPFVQKRLKLRRENQTKIVLDVATALAAAGVRSGKDLFDADELAALNAKEE